MTWNELAQKIAQMTPEQRGTDATVVDLVSDEVFPIKDFVTKWTNPIDRDRVDGILDENHPYLTFE